MARTQHGWAGFWNQGTWWKAVLLIAVYWGVYQLLGLGLSSLFTDLIDPNDLLAPSTVFFAELLPVVVAGILLVLFARSVGWLDDLFGPQPLRGKGWMWIAVALVVIPIVLRLIGTEWSAYSMVAVLTLLLFGLAIGFTEELATRGLVVTMLRKGGHGERLAFVMASVLFALLHAGNLITGMAPGVVLLTVVYTFGFGAMMYLSMRITGRLYWAMLLHAATDPTTMLASGGIDAHSGSEGSAGFLTVAGLFNYVYILFGLVAIFLVKARAERSATRVA